MDNNDMGRTEAAPSIASPYVAYEIEKTVWDKANPHADNRTREAAMREIAKTLGV